MKVSHYEKREVEERVIDDIICNQCGRSCRTFDQNYDGLLEARVEGGYGAKLGDLTYYVFSLCEDCLEKLFRGFKHPPEMGNCVLR